MLLILQNIFESLTFHITYTFFLLAILTLCSPTACTVGREGILVHRGRLDSSVGSVLGFWLARYLCRTGSNPANAASKK